MAIAKGRETVESSFKRYIGVAACYIKAVNPDKAKLEEFYGSQDKEPEYVGEVEVNDGDKVIKVPNIRITVSALPDPKLYGDLKPINVTMFIQRRYRYNKDKSKVQVIDKYGRTAWVTIDQCKKHEIPMYSNGPANIDKDYRPAYVGEEDVTNFIINYLGIPPLSWRDKRTGIIHTTEHPEECECRLDHIENYFKGNVSELKDAVSLQPDNKVNILFGVRTDSEGKQYQTAFTQMFLKGNVKDYAKLDKEVQERKNAGAFATTEFECTDFHEYVVKSSIIEDNKSEDPFSPSTNSSSTGSNPWDLQEY